jgi:hypothetical protein
MASSRYWMLYVVVLQSGDNSWLRAAVVIIGVFCILTLGVRLAKLWREETR